MTRADGVKLSRSPGVKVYRVIDTYLMHAAPASAKQVSLPSRCVTQTMTKNSFWSWLAPVMAVNPDTCSPPNRFAMTTKHGCAFVLSYTRRRQVEKSLRFSKCELAFEGSRVQGWHTRLKLLLIATLAYAFLLSSLDPIAESLKQWLLSDWCHRTGKRRRETPTPLYLLRMALSRLWMTHPPPYLVLLRSG